MRSVFVDTSVWVDHFRHRNDVLFGLLEMDLVTVHPFVLGEIACGTPPNRNQTLADLSGLQKIQQASLGDAIEFIERERLFGLGCGLVDLLLLASTLMSPGVDLLSTDKLLCPLAERFSVNYQPALH